MIHVTMTGRLRSTLEDIYKGHPDPELRLLIAAVLRGDPDAVVAINARGELTRRLLRELRLPQSKPQPLPRLHLVR